MQRKCFVELLISTNPSKCLYIYVCLPNFYRISRINRRLVATIEGSSSDDGLDGSDAHAARKKLRKRRKIRSGAAKSQLQGIEAVSDGDTDDAVDINDSDCSESQIQSAMLGHLRGKAPFLSSVANSLIGMPILSGGENDGSYSSPLSQKSGKNMADFDDDDSPCEEELAQLAASSHCLAAFASTRNRSIPDNFHSNRNNSNNSSLTVNATATRHNSSSKSVDSTKTNLMTASEVSQPSNILLWDLLMDDKIVSRPNGHFHLKSIPFHWLIIYIFIFRIYRASWVNLWLLKPKKHCGRCFVSTPKGIFVQNLLKVVYKIWQIIEVLSSVCDYCQICLHRFNNFVQLIHIK